jgi:hypothetical protein
LTVTNAISISAATVQFSRVLMAELAGAVTNIAYACGANRLSGLKEDDLPEPAEERILRANEKHTSWEAAVHAFRFSGTAQFVLFADSFR